jgi:hypothetical protein
MHVKTRSVFVTAAVTLVFVACGDQPQRPAGEKQQPAAEPAKVTITVTDEGFEIFGELEAEPVEITLRNEGTQRHLGFFGKLNEGVAEEDVRGARSQEDFFQLITVAGGVPSAEPGGTSEVTIRFPEGSYVILDPEARGGPPPMGFFEVSAATGPEVAEPTTDWTIEAGDFYFEIAGAVPGPSTVEVLNVGQQAHEVVMTPEGGGDEEDSFFTMAPAPGGALWTETDLAPGTFTVVCHFPDPESGREHAELGMRTKVELT